MVKPEGTIEGIPTAFTSTGTGFSHPVTIDGGSVVLWAIDPAALQSVLKDAAIALRDGEVKQSSYSEVTEDGLAIFRLFGPIGRRMSGFDAWMFDGVDSDAVGAELLEAAANPAIRGILLHIDSPGGSVAGTKELRDIVAGIEKPVVAFSDGAMLSAAYWIGSAADRVVGTPTALFGSVGIVATHIDKSKMLERMGLKVTHIYNGALKTVGTEAEPLSEAGIEYLQARVDDIYSLFASDVAQGRGIAAEAVRRMESAVFIGEKARAQGLVDGIGSFTETYTQTRRGVGIMDLKELKTEFASLYGEVITIGKASITKEEAAAMFPEIARDAEAAGIVVGAERERTRITEIRESAFEGQTELVERLIKEGTSADDARKTILQDQKTRSKTGLANMLAGDPGGLGQNAEGSAAPIAAKNRSEAGDKLTEIARNKVKEKGLSFEKALAEACTEQPALTAMYRGK